MHILNLVGLLVNQAVDAKSILFGRNVFFQIEVRGRLHAPRLLFHSAVS
jgi:hypothetical protein